MEPGAASDSIVLIAGPGLEVLSALSVLMVAIVGAAVGVEMARRGRVEAWSLVGVFGLVILGAVLVLTHVPTRLVLDRTGAHIAFWVLRDQRPWSEIDALTVRHGRFGLWVSASMRNTDGRVFSLWSRWPGLFVPESTVEPRQIAMRIDAWRLGNRR
jgi:hypothetical protein